ncbi:uncharacterized protein LODBEIA_P21760 [Lodderomyces beijingensis]|uniref:Dolichyl-diphosphooligosaccharide--protein glycosyltransferase subunit 1 n=1 Tax=Lodderomyces beijingensis TaxID=1775926 RepID=A0ABP0ZP63_9ASCO
MWSQYILIIGALTSICMAHITSLYTFEPNWENTHYARTIDLSKGYVKETDLITVKNTVSTPQREYYYMVNDGFDSVGELAIFSVVLGDQLVEVPFDEIVPNQVFKLELPVPVAPNSELELRVNYVYIDKLEAVPQKLAKLEDVQQLLFKTNKFVYSPYPTRDYSMSLSGMTKGQEMELHIDDEVNATTTTTSLSPRVEGTSLKYGPLDSVVEPFTLKPMGLMYDHNRPLAKAISLNRSVWLPASNVNRIQIEEYYELTNGGAQLSTGFSRVDWMKGRYEHTRNHWALSHLEIPLLSRKFDDYYYVDKVGVVSTHQIAQNHLILMPRFPLLGNWHYNFTLGWTEEMGEFVHQSNAQPDEFLIKLPLLNSVRDISYKDVYLEFYLPENAEFLGVASPVPYDSVVVDHELSYLDVAKGHVKVTVHYKNLFDDMHKVDVIVKYKYNPRSVLLKVFKISGFVFVGLISYYLLSIL